MDDTAILPRIGVACATNGPLRAAADPLFTAALSDLWLEEGVRPVQAGGFLVVLGVGTPGGREDRDGVSG
jgi:hypothetical protein